MIKLLARNKGELRRAVSKKLALKFAPDLRFQLDETFDQMDDTRRMLNQDDVRRDLKRRTHRNEGGANLAGADDVRPACAADSCTDVTYLEVSYTICEVI